MTVHEGPFSALSASRRSRPAGGPEQVQDRRGRVGASTRSDRLAISDQRATEGEWD